jgi:glycosidase
MTDEGRARILDHLTAIYGVRTAEATLPQVLDRLQRYAGRIPGPDRTGWSEQDALLITYADQIRQPPEAPLRSLAGFCHRHLAGLISGVHLLPFFPSTSDDGFSVVDFRQVDPANGSWRDILDLRGEFRLMLDAVVNHVSVGSAWFQAFLRREAPFSGYFLTPSPGADLSAVIRPRTSPLLTSFSSLTGERAVWTTFSADQVDLNYASPEVLLEIVDLLLFYASQGAALLRLDAVAFLWKEPGTSCLHLPQTHRLVQLFRTVLDLAAPHVLLVTETNVPHADNISYFGDGRNEAQLVYNFALPPLVLDALVHGSASTLTRWAASLAAPSQETTFFNFLASHDGIGLNPARGLIGDERIRMLVDRTLAHEGQVSSKRNPDGSQSPYELNINYFDALSDPRAREPLAMQVDRFMAAQAVMLSLAGVPGIYVHSLLGSRGWPEGARQTGRARSINREKLDLAALERELRTSGSLRALVFQRFASLLRARRASPAFHPNAGQRVLDLGEAVFGLVRTAAGVDDSVVCLHNLSGRRVSCPPIVAPEAGNRVAGWTDMTERTAAVALDRPFELAPYQVAWFRSQRRPWAEGAALPRDEASA